MIFYVFEIHHMGVYLKGLVLRNNPHQLEEMSNEIILKEIRVKKKQSKSKIVITTSTNVINLRWTYISSNSLFII